jgi:hypothetical protein
MSNKSKYQSHVSVSYLSHVCYRRKSVISKSVLRGEYQQRNNYILARIFIMVCYKRKVLSGFYCSSISLHVFWVSFLADSPIAPIEIEGENAGEFVCSLS